MPSDCIADDVRERTRINAVIRVYLDRPTWTAATAVLLLYGVLPEPNCTEIPNQGRQLRDPLQMASPSWFYRAKRLLDRWIDEQQEDYIVELTAATEIKPWQFLAWCEESYRDSSESWPDWLDYFLSFCGYSRYGNMLPSIPPAYVDCALALVTLNGLAAADGGGEGTSFDCRPPSEGVSNQITKKGRSCQAEGDILTAMKRVAAVGEDEFELERVWVELCNMVQAGCVTYLKSFGEVTKISLEYGSFANGRPFTRRALRNFLNVRRAKRDAGAFKPNVT